MALGTNHVTTTTLGTNDAFIPELWSNEVIAAYKSNLVLANLVTKFDHRGKKGDTIHIPNFTRGSASAKAAETEVTLITATESQTDVSIAQHWEYSVMIEDIAEVQALSSYRTAYTDDAGYSLGTTVDRYLFNRAMALNGGTAPTFENDNDYADSNFGSNESSAGAVIGSDGSTHFDGDADNAASLTDVGIRELIKELDDNDVPLSERFLVIPPVEKKSLLGIPRFTEQAFVGEASGGNSIRSGLIGDVYGVPVYVSTNCPTDRGGSQDARMALIAHRSALVHVEQIGIRTQTQYKQEYLGTLFTADTVFGASELRDYAGIPIAVPA